MVEVAPFKALRWNVKKKGRDISKNICPPYDVISAEQRRMIEKKSVHNVVQLELPKGSGDLKYLNAAKILRKWREQGMLQDDRHESFYLLETTFKISDAFAPNKKLKRYGVLVGLKLETPGKGNVRPHEKTLPKAKEDRLNLLSSIRTNISPIFGLFFDPKKKWKRWISKATKQKVTAFGKENANLSHRLWKIEKPGLISQLKQLVKRKELYIADGHHRYEVSWAYRDTRYSNEPYAEQGRGWQYVMTYICPIEESGLLMLPTHRLVKNKKTIKEWEIHLSRFFKISTQKNEDHMLTTLKKAKPKDRVIGWVNAKGHWLLTLRKDIAIDRCLSNRPPALRALDVILLHDLALEEADGATYIKGKDIFYTQDITGMFTKTKKDPAWVGFVLRSAGVSSLAKVAKAGEVMPPKTTYFYPKVPTGFTLMPLEQEIY